MLRYAQVHTFTLCVPISISLSRSVDSRSFRSTSYRVQLSPHYEDSIYQHGGQRKKDQLKMSLQLASGHMLIFSVRKL